MGKASESINNNYRAGRRRGRRRLRGQDETRQWWQQQLLFSFSCAKKMGDIFAAFHCRTAYCRPSPFLSFLSILHPSCLINLPHYVDHKSQFCCTVLYTVGRVGHSCTLPLLICWFAIFSFSCWNMCPVVVLCHPLLPKPLKDKVKGCLSESNFLNEWRKVKAAGRHAVHRSLE